MKRSFGYFTCISFILLLGLTRSAVAADFGDPKDVKQVRQIVTAKFGHALHASVSHDWALCTAYDAHSDVSVVLHRTGSAWKVVDHDGGAYVAEILKSMKVPDADIPALLKAYQ